MRTEARRLVLFDIDGTLITSGGAGEGALIDAMKSLFGVEEDFRDITLAGATDALIARALLEKHAIEASEENCVRLLDRYLEHLTERMPRHEGFLLPGILELLESLRLRNDVALGLLTGNLSRGAEIKLTHFGVWHFFPFGAFADDHHDRNELGKFARRRALTFHGYDFPASHVFVLGDTPKDIACGRAIDARTVAIATGQYSYADLERHAPDFLFADLSDTQAVLNALLS